MRFAPVVLATAALSSAVLGLSATGTLSAFTASITNSSNTAAEGTIVMQEQNSGATVTCLSTDAGANSNDINTNASTCSSINKFGGSTTLTPGTSSSATVTIKNVGTAAVSTFTLAPGAAGCTQSNVGTTYGSATDVCAQMNLTIVSGATTVYSGKVGSFASTTLASSLIPTAGGSATSFTFTVSLPSSAGNTYQGKQVSLPLVWTFSS